MNIQLTAEEIAILQELIEARIDELGPEIHHTRTPDYRDRLKELRRKLRTVYDRLGDAGP
jgi:Mg2+ and Co2+ transporter CorA